MRIHALQDSSLAVEALLHELHHLLVLRLEALLLLLPAPVEPLPLAHRIILHGLRELPTFPVPVIAGGGRLHDTIRDLAMDGARLTAKRAADQMTHSHADFLLLPTENLLAHRSEDHLPVVVVVLVDRVGPLGPRGDLGLLLTWRTVEQRPIPPRTHRAHPSDPDFRDLAALPHDFLLTRKRFAQPLSYPPSD